MKSFRSLVSMAALSGIAALSITAIPANAATSTDAAASLARCKFHCCRTLAGSGSG
jgi:hypothetical protein